METPVKDIATKVGELGTKLASQQITSDDEMALALAALRDLREDATSINDKVDAARKRFEEENTVLLEAASQHRTMLLALELTIRGYAVSRYSDSPEIGKHPWAGVEIAVGSEIDYPDDQALAYCIEHKQCLALDTKEFGKLCKIASLRPDFVTETEKITARIATDLAKALEAQEG
jgi:hypothetical protein